MKALKIQQRMPNIMDEKHTKLAKTSREVIFNL
jgi:hypothetical protein